MFNASRGFAVGVVVAALLVAACGESRSPGGNGTGGTGGASGAGGYDAAWQATLAEVQDRAAQLGIPGVGLAIVIDGKLAFSGGVGIRSDDGQLVTGNTLFRSSSAVSKPAVAVALLELADEGALDLEAPIRDVVPAIHVDPRYADAIDLDLVLLQRSGLAVTDYRTTCSAENADVLHFYEGRSLVSEAPPDAVWGYTAAGSVMGAAVLETLERRPFTDVVRDRVLVPAGMTTATYDLAQVQAREHALGHLRGFQVPLDADRGLACGERMASTGLYASAADHAHFLEALLTPGRLLDATGLEKLEGRNHNPGFGAGWSYGYQVYGLDYKGVRVYHHYGSSEGFTTGVSWVPARGFGVVLLTNAGEGTHFANVYAVEELRWRIIDRFLELTGREPDNSTPPATWSKYVGTYVDPAKPATKIEIGQSDADALTLAIVPGIITPIVLTQGGLDVPYEGGDLFNYDLGANLGLVGFFPGADGKIRWVGVYTTQLGQFVGERER